jgi:hypothetical protein
MYTDMSTEPSHSVLRLVASSETAEHDHAASLLDAGLDIAYQPIIQLGSGSVIAYEALARPRHPAITGPFEFFGALDGAGRRIEAELVALEAAAWGFQPPLPRVKLFINASPTTLVDPSFSVTELVELLQRHGLGPTQLVVEVTESEAVEDLQALSARMATLRRVGGTSREGVVSEAFKTLLKDWGRSRDLIFIPQYEYQTLQKARVYPDGALLYSLRVPLGYSHDSEALTPVGC